MKNGRRVLYARLRRIASTIPAAGCSHDRERRVTDTGFSIKGESNRGRRFSSAVKYSRTSWGVLGLAAAASDDFRPSLQGSCAPAGQKPCVVGQVHHDLNHLLGRNDNAPRAAACIRVAGTDDVRISRACVA